MHQARKLFSTSMMIKKMKNSLTIITVTMTGIDTSKTVMTAESMMKMTNKSTFTGIKMAPSVTLYQAQASTPTVIPKTATILASRRDTQPTTEVSTKITTPSSSPIRNGLRMNSVKKIALNRLNVAFTQG